MGFGLTSVDSRYKFSKVMCGWRVVCIVDALIMIKIRVDSPGVKRGLQPALLEMG